MGGADGLRVWRFVETQGLWKPEQMDAPTDLTVPMREVAWKTWDGISEMLASAVGHDVIIWLAECRQGGVECWRMSQRVNVGQEVWHLQWTDMGNALLVSCGEED